MVFSDGSLINLDQVMDRISGLVHVRLSYFDLLIADIKPVLRSNYARTPGRLTRKSDRAGVGGRMITRGLCQEQGQFVVLHYESSS